MSNAETSAGESTQATGRITLVVTSIAPPTETLRALAAGCTAAGYRFIVVGDEKSPTDFTLADCEFYGLQRQHALGFRLATLCPVGHYSRKNLGYLLAIAQRAPLLLETDDDNIPLATFWRPRAREVAAPLVSYPGWVNVYRYFTDQRIWPRGFPLDALHDSQPAIDPDDRPLLACPIQQGLADGDPDVDAIYRLTTDERTTFRRDLEVAIAPGGWCPFNSQNTAWWPEVYPLLYLPSYCTFRMTDIWRSFVAQRIAWANGWHVLFRSPDMSQSRNQHDLMRDFADEVPGYLNNRAICEALAELPVRSGVEQIPDNLRASYQLLTRRRWVGDGELELLDAWLADLAGLTSDE